jgi:hypothetical protein
VVGEEVLDRFIPGQRGDVTVEIEVIGDVDVTVVSDPRLDDAGPQPNVEVVLLGIASVGENAAGVPLDKGDELRSADFVDKTLKRPMPETPRQMAQLRIQQIAGAVPDAVAVGRGNALRRIERTAIDVLASADDPLL